MEGDACAEMIEGCDNFAWSKYDSSVRVKGNCRGDREEVLEGIKKGRMVWGKQDGVEKRRAGLIEIPKERGIVTQYRVHKRVQSSPWPTFAVGKATSAEITGRYLVQDVATIGGRETNDKQRKWVEEARR